MDNESMHILCSDSKCIYHGGQGYYGLCENPQFADSIQYGGIVRMYQESCSQAKYEFESEDD